MSEVSMDEYKNISEKLVNTLKLDKSPVAVKMFKTEDEAKNLLPKYDGKVRHCQMVYTAAEEKKSFYATEDEIDCKIGAGSLGIIDLPTLKVERFEPVYKAVGYAPLEDANFEADAIVLYCNVMQAFNFTSLYRQATGKRFEPNFAGTQALCSEIIVIPNKTEKPNLSLGCRGSRKFSGLREDEEVIGLTIDDAKVITDNIIE